jgi:monoamine oxidase
MIWEGTDNQMQVASQISAGSLLNSEVEISVFAGGPETAGRDEAYYKRKLEELYPGYSASNSGRKTQLVSWPTIEFIMTGYSCPKPGHMFTVAQVLQKSYGDRLYLAGEHTETGFFGFMEGALRSGCRASTTVMNRICPGAFPNFPTVTNVA